MKDFFAEADLQTVPVSFEIGRHTIDGETPRFTHHLRVVDAVEAQSIVDRLTTAGTGRTGDEREEASHRALRDVWSELIVSVDGYGENVDVLERAGLCEYFSGATLPSDLDAERVKRIRAAMLDHLMEAIRLYLDRWSPEPSFRRLRA